MHLYIFWFGNINIVLKKIKLGEINKKNNFGKGKICRTDSQTKRQGPQNAAAALPHFHFPRPLQVGPPHVSPL